MPLSANAADLAWVCDRCLRVSVAGEGGQDALNRVASACHALRTASVPGLVDLTPAFATILVHFDPAGLVPASAEASVLHALRGSATHPAPAATRTIEVPVCYDPECGPDLRPLAAAIGLRTEDVVRLHAGPKYQVAFLGFAPGFPYLVGLPSRLAAPRRPSPRIRVPAGSVAIAGEQTGIYPHPSPGGWQLIGRTPLRLFAPDRDPPALLAMGDLVRFFPIDAQEFEREREVHWGNS